jgi:quercetin dioxygenase-like cupin family protein
MTNPFPPIRRIVTGHDAQGRATFAADDRFPSETIALGGAEFALLWTTATVPADNNDATDGRERDAGLTIDRGSVIRVVDFLPGGDSPFHRTNSIDYGIVLEGEIELELEDGRKTIAGPHSVIVQRGTNHKWRNPSATQHCRVIFVLIEAPAYLHDGAPLPEDKP